jgi:hypothetical protein
MKHEQACICQGCHSEIETDILHAMNLPFHPDCFICTDCRKPIVNSFVNLRHLSNGGKPPEIHSDENPPVLCIGCAKLRTKHQVFTSKTDIVTDGERVTTPADSTRPPGIPRRTDIDPDFNKRCAVCRDALTNEVIGINVSGKDLVLHRSCFICTSCHMPLLDLIFVPEITSEDYRFWHFTVGAV